MNPELAAKFSSVKPFDKQRNKTTLKKPQNIKSHIVFAGDPAYQQESLDYIPVGRRKKIFYDNQANILPPDLLADQEHSVEHNGLASNQRLFNRNNFSSFDRQFSTVRPSGYTIKEPSKRFQSGKLREETFLEPNNLEADINFGIIREQDPNAAFKSSKASQTTQKKGGIIYHSNQPLPINHQANPLVSANKLQNSMPPISFSYQGKQLPKQSDQISQSRVQTRIPPFRTTSPQKSQSRTIFLNEGGVMVPKSKKIPLQDSNFFDFQGVDNESYQEHPNAMMTVIRSEAIKQGETPEFNKKNSKIGSNAMINNSLINEFNHLESETHFNKLNEGTIAGMENHNNTSAVSYKSIQKQFEAEKMMGSNVLGKTNLEEQNSINQKGEESAMIKALQHIGDRYLKSNDHSQSMSLEERQSMFDQLLKDREKIFNKNKKQEEEVVVPKRVAEKKSSSTRKVGEVMAESGFKSITKPSDFITESSAAPKGAKRNINIKNVAGNDYDKVKDLYKQEQEGVPKPMMQSKVKRIELRSETDLKEQAQQDQQKSRPSQKNRSQRKQLKPFQSPHFSKRTTSQIIQDLNDHEYSEREEQKRSVQQQEEESLNDDLYQRKKRKQKPQRKTKLEDDSQLEDFLNLQKNTINVLEANHLPLTPSNIAKAITNANLKKTNPNSNKPTNLSTANETPVNQQGFREDGAKLSIVVNNMESLTVEQRELLNSMGFRLMSSVQLSNHRPTANFSNSKEAPLNVNSSEQAKGTESKVHYMSHPNSNQFASNQSNQKQNNGMGWGLFHGGPGLNQPMNPSLMNQENVKIMSLEEMEQKFDQITQTLYKQLARVLSGPSIALSSSNQQIPNINYTNSSQQPNLNSNLLNPINSSIKQANGSFQQVKNGNYFDSRSFKGQQMNESVISFRGNESSNSNGLNYFNNKKQLNPNQNHVTFHRDDRLNHRDWNSNKQTQVTVPQPITDYRKRQKQMDQFYSPINQEELRNFNQHPSGHYRKSSSKQKPNFRQSFHDSTHYYSFYHDDNSDPAPINEPRAQFQVDPHSYYPIKQRNNSSNSQPSLSSPLRAKFDIRNKKFSNSELEMLFNQIQQISQEIHHELPLIRQEIEQNQQQIRKIQTNLLVRNTAEQHQLINILQKMKIKEAQLKQKQLQAHQKDQELSFYQEELTTLKQEFISRKDLMKEVENETYFDNRLQKIRNYNENLCEKIAQAKKTPRPLASIV